MDKNYEKHSPSEFYYSGEVDENAIQYVSKASLTIRSRDKKFLGWATKTKTIVKKSLTFLLTPEKQIIHA